MSRLVLRCSVAGLTLAIVTGCAQSFDPPPTPALIASMPDAIPCERAVLVQAGSERAGVHAERRWLDAYYPRHKGFNQAVISIGAKRFDVLSFERANGHQASVCFDITGFFGR